MKLPKGDENRAGKESPYAKHSINKEILLNKYHTY